MKTIGLIGGMSWESTVTYYQIINETVKRKLGGLHSAKLLLYSVDFAEIEIMQAAGDWYRSGEILADAAQRLEAAGADFIVICTNTMHKVAQQVQARISVPLLHIAEATAQALKAEGIKKVGLLGTKYTMTQDFYRDKLVKAGLEVIIPDAEGVDAVNSIIYKELCLGMISESSRQKFLKIIDEMQARGAQGVILGCTEIGLLVRQQDTPLPVFDTTQIHAEKAALHALGLVPDSRCGLTCFGCQFVNSCGCGGCIATGGHPFHGECSVAVCCQRRNLLHCGQCAEFPCSLLKEYSEDPEHGDNPPGARIMQCRKWMMN